MVEARICYLERERARIEKPFVATLTKEEVLLLARNETLLEDLVGRPKEPPPILGPGKRIVCPLPLPGRSALSLVALETDAREYGIDAPKTARLLSAFRIVREAAAQNQRAEIRRIRSRSSEA